MICRARLLDEGGRTRGKDIAQLLILRITGDDDHLGIRRHGFDATKHLKAAELGQYQIEQHQLNSVFGFGIYPKGFEAVFAA